MRMAGVVKGKSEAERNVSIGEKVRLYRECANLPQTIFAERVGITLDTLKGIEAGMVLLNTKLLMKISEELKIGYSDLFEADEELYYPNIKDKNYEVYPLIRKRMKEKNYGYKFLAEKLDNKATNIANWLNRSYIPSPFNFQNLCTILDIVSKDLNTEQPVNKVVEVKEEPKQNDIMTNVMNACNLYMQIGEMVDTLNVVIEHAQNLKDMLEKYKWQGSK